MHQTNKLSPNLEDQEKREELEKKQLRGDGEQLECSKCLVEFGWDRTALQMLAGVPKELGSIQLLEGPQPRVAVWRGFRWRDTDAKATTRFKCTGAPITWHRVEVRLAEKSACAGVWSLPEAGESHALLTRQLPSYLFWT